MKHTRLISVLIAIIIIFSQIAACSILSPAATVDPVMEYPKAEVVFQVNIPEPLPEGSTMVLEILDDITGLYFNSSRFEMAKSDDLNYFIRVPFAISSEVKYRYLKSGTGTEYEYNSQNQQVRFRILKIDGPTIIQDIVSTWIGKPFSGPQGRIMGQAIDQTNNAPIPNMLISAGGQQTVTSSDGTFVLEGLKPGVHNLVMYSMDGAYETFQQGALIAEGGVTPVIVFINKRPTTEVTFTVRLSEEIDETLPIYFVSNLLNKGNAYAELSAGSAGSSVNYPAMKKVAKLQYSIKLTLPVGAYIRYKYSLGDGFWNAELDKNGKFIVRDLIIEKNQSRKDLVAAFTATNTAPVQIIAQVPSSTPANESVYIQLNPFDWMEPIPMVSSEERVWHYTIYGPMHLLGPIQYRFCRNGQCGIANGITDELVPFQVSAEDQTINVDINSWQSFEAGISQPQIVTEGGPTQPRTGFFAGIELTPGYSPTWKSSIDQGLNASQSMGSDWVILTPTWSASQGVLPLLQAVPGRDLLWNELQDMNNHILLNKQKTIFFPNVNYTQSAENFWSASGKSDAWWVSWYEKYQHFILSNADIANMLNITALILGDPSVIPSMQGGILTDGNPSNAPDNADERWRQLITDVRSRYKGSVVGVAVIDANHSYVPAWLDSVDAIYVLFSPSINDAANLSVTQIRSQIDSMLTEKVRPIKEKYQKPIILGISYPSNVYAVDGFTNSSIYRISQVNEVSEIDVNLELQSKIYNAVILSAASSNWIDGFFSRGYYPYVSLQDPSSSIYQKPAADILWFWFHFLLNKTP